MTESRCMTGSRPWALVVLLALTAGGLACAADSGAARGQDEAQAEDQEQAAELPEGHPETGLPPEHPPLGGSPQPMTLPEVPPGAGTGAAGLVWKVPETWVSETPSSPMRRAQYRVSGAAGQAECVVFYFGPGQGGDPKANAVRWADQFGQPDGRASRELLKTEEIEVGGIPVLLTEVTGTYTGGMASMGGPVESLEDHMLLGAIAQGGDANWFFKFTGPRETVAAHREGFLTMIRSLQRGS